MEYRNGVCYSINVGLFFSCRFIWAITMFQLWKLWLLKKNGALAQRRTRYLIFIFCFQTAFLFFYRERFSCPRFVCTVQSRRRRWASGWTQRWTFLLKQPSVCWRSCATGRAGTHIISNPDTCTTEAPRWLFETETRLSLAFIWLFPAKGLKNKRSLVSLIVHFYICQVLHSALYSLPFCASCSCSSVLSLGSKVFPVVIWSALV